MISRDDFAASSNICVTCAQVASLWRLPTSGRFNMMVVMSFSLVTSTGSAMVIPPMFSRVTLGEGWRDCQRLQLRSAFQMFQGFQSFQVILPLAICRCSCEASHFKINFRPIANFRRILWLSKL